jgi:hypothetical protein
MFIHPWKEELSQFRAQFRRHALYLIIMASCAFLRNRFGLHPFCLHCQVIEQYTGTLQVLSHEANDRHPEFPIGLNHRHIELLR